MAGADMELLTSAQVLEMLQIGRTKLWDLVRRGAFPAYRIGEGRNVPLRFRRSEVLGWLDSQRVIQPPADTAQRQAGSPRE
jgi:excisionase family DNA binding protein